MINLYVIRNRDGQYFRAKGYGGTRDSWVAEIEKARLYTKLGPARTQVSFWANNYPAFGVPEIVVLAAQETGVLDETSRVEKTQERRRKREEEYQVRQRQREVKEAQERLKEAREELKGLRRRGASVTGSF